MAAALAVAALLVAAAPGRVARAATTFTVNTTADDVDANPADFICATAAGKCSLRAAVQTVDALGWGNTIVVPAGTYTLTRPSDPNDTAAANGDLDIVGSQTIRGAGSGSTIVQASAHVDDADDRVFDVRTSSATVAFSGMTIRHGAGVNFGGGIGVAAIAVVSLTHIILSGNEAQSGAGISGEGQLTVTDSVISGNIGQTGSGIDWAGNLTVRTTTVNANESTGSLAVGAIWFRRVPTAQASTLLIDRSLIFGNTGPTAAAVSIGEGNGDTSSAFIRNSTVTGNTATEAGATVIRVVAPAQLAFESATVASNASVAVKTPSKAATTAMNSIFARNGTKSCLTPITSLGHNLDGGTSCGLNGVGDRIGTDPHLGALGSNGGPTRTMALASNSPAIDAGGTCPSVDQRGQSRPKDGDGDGVKRCDIGAYERKAVTLVATPSPSPTATVAPTSSPDVTEAPTAAPSVAPTAAGTAPPSSGPSATSIAIPAPTATAGPAIDASAGGGTIPIVLVVIIILVVLLALIAWQRRRPGEGGVR